MEDKKEFEVTKEELAKAVTIYVAGESGIIEDVSPEEAGQRGALIADLTETGRKFVNGEITKEQVEQEVIEKTVSFAVSQIVDKILEISIETIASKVEKKLPQVAKFLRTVKAPIKNFVKEKVINN